MAQHIEESRKLIFGIIGNLIEQVDMLFHMFKKDCKYRDGLSCNHKDNHEDFALVNICSIERCPIMGQDKETL